MNRYAECTATVKVVPPSNQSPTYNIVGLTEHEFIGLLAALKHCSGGHIAANYWSSEHGIGPSIPGTLYNRLTAQTGITI